jgi:hypothetical protein
MDPSVVLSAFHSITTKAPTQPLYFVFPIIPHNYNPVWTSCYFDFPFRKGALRDGRQPIRMQPIVSR